MAENPRHSTVPDLEALPPSAVERGRHFALLVAVFIACVAWIILTRLHTADEPLERDICTQILMGRVLAEGGRLYVDTLEFKPPGMFVIWQVVHQLAGTGPRVVLWVNILVATLAMLGVFWAGSAKPWGRAGGLWAMGFWTLICGDMMLEANQPNNELFMNLFLIWGVALWVRADSAPAGAWLYAAAGLFLGLVTLIKPVLITVGCMALAWALAAVLSRAPLKRHVRSIGWVLLPLVAAWALMVLYFVCQDRGRELYDSLVKYAMFYAGNKGGIMEGAPQSVWLNIAVGLHEKLYLPCMFFLIPLLGMTIVGVVGAWLDGHRTQALMVAGWLLGTVLAVIIPGTYYPHYYQLYLPILAIGAGWGVAAVANSLRQRVLATGIGLATLLLLLGHVVPDLRRDAKTWSLLKYPDPKGIFIEMERCGRAVNRLLLPDEPVYVWGDDPGVYYYSDRQPASGIFWADRLLFGPLKQTASQKVLNNLNEHRPPLILIEDFWQPPAQHPVFQWIARYYVLSPETRFSSYFTVYIRRDSALAARLATNAQPFALTLADVDPRFLRQTGNELLIQGRVGEAAAYLQKAEQLEREAPNGEQAGMRPGR